MLRSLWVGVMKDPGSELGRTERILNYGGWAHKRASEVPTCKGALEESSPQRFRNGEARKCYVY